MLTLLGLAFWVIVLIVFTSPMWILLAVCWAPAAILTFLVFKYTQAGEKVIDASEGLFYYLTYQSKWARKIIWKFIYNTFSWYLTNDSKLASLNCGYALLTENGETLQLSSKTDKHHRFQYQMYHYAALGIKFQDSLEGKRVLDLGCGRGGGVALLAKCFKPQECVGVDISSHQISFAKNKFEGIDNLKYVTGDVENLAGIKSTLSEGIHSENGRTFDLILSIESAHCFSNAQSFLKGAKQLLSKGRESHAGSLVIADIFEKAEIEEIEREYVNSGFKIHKKEVITFNVKHAMQLDKPRVEKYISLISTNILIKRFLRNFMGSAEESRTYSQLGKTKEYICYVLKAEEGFDRITAGRIGSQNQQMGSVNLQQSL